MSGDDLRAGAVFGAAFLVLLAAAEIWARRLGGKPEWTRKVVHVGGGAISLFLPSHVASPWTVLVLAVATAGFILAGRRWGFLRCVHGVNRKSRGSEYYPVAMFLVFLLAHEHPWLYAASILVLAAADGAAALIGTRYGRIRYGVEDEEKSLEGSLAFLAVAFVAITVPMLVATDLPLAIVLLSAILVGLLVTAVEAVSLNGGDNLFVPLAVTVVLDATAAKPQGEIVSGVTSLVLLFVCLGLLVRGTRAFNAGATLVLVLFAWGAWALGSWLWAIPVLTGLVPFILFRYATSPGDDYLGHARVRVLSRVLLAPFLIAALAARTSAHAFLYGPFLAACAAVLAMSSWRYLVWLRKPEGLARTAGAALTALAAWAVVVLPAAMLHLDTSGTTLAAATAVLVTSLLAAVLFDRFLGSRPVIDSATLWPVRQTGLVVLAAGLVAAAQWNEWVPAWKAVSP